MTEKEMRNFSGPEVIQTPNATADKSDKYIPFDIERLKNVGGAMNLQTGKFTAPRTGKYFFLLIHRSVWSR
jgi:hypothetical protein